MSYSYFLSLLVILKVEPFQLFKPEFLSSSPLHSFSGERSPSQSENMAANDVPCCETMFWVYLIVSVALVAFAGLMSGLTLGLMSLSVLDLEVLIRAGQPKDRKNAGWFLVYLFRSVSPPPSHKLNLKAL